MGDNTGVPPTLTRRPPADAACTDAVDLARTAALDAAGSVVGEALGHEVEGERLVTHYFASTQGGYVGWRWAVTVARAPRAKIVTVSEISLLPGPDALLAPDWLPWSERLRPGDLGVGDMLPTAPDDDRLVPGYATGDDENVDQVAVELGLGRPRVMSRLGRLEATQRWYDGDRGPDAPIAKAAPAPCGTCGFYLPMAGSLRAMFGVCGNEFAPDDGQVVAADHGCGAHSEALVEAVVLPEAERPFSDDAAVEVVAIGSEEESESLGHS